MFNVTTSKGDFKISFRYDNESERRKTHCMIYDKDLNLVGSGTTECSPRDNFNRVTGRKISFTKALENTCYGLCVNNKMTLFVDSKTWRTEMWNGYFALDMRTR